MINTVTTAKQQSIPATEQAPQIMSELLNAATALACVGPAVSIFGSARLPASSPWYQQAEQIGALLAQAGFAVIAGGGPGIMEAANKGACLAQGTSIGLNIRLPFETTNNAYQTIALHFDYFLSRKATFFMHSMAYVVLPGGFGTLDEVMEVLTLVQTGKIPRGPIVLVGRAFWSGLVDWIREQLLGGAMIAPQDIALFSIEDDVHAVVQTVTAFWQNQGSARGDDRYAPCLPA